MFFSVIVPVYNRPNEIQELLESLVNQDYQEFEVIVIEDGSYISCKKIIESFKDILNINYFFIDNVGQGFARNFGMDKAKGDYFLLFDSDCVIPSFYLRILKEALIHRKLDAHGGPDAASDSFNDFQKAINFSMTSFLTTGGIRGRVKDPKKYEARGYNMGFSKDVFLATGGFIETNQAEDIELSLRIRQLGFQLELVSEAYVYHKRRTNWIDFMKQSYSFGRNRIRVSQHHPYALKLVHFLPSAFLIFNALLLVSFLLPFALKMSVLTIFFIWGIAILTEAYWKNRSFPISFIALLTSWLQLNAYGLGFMKFFLAKIFR